MPKGSCLCGSVAYVADAPFEPALACHCKECRQQSGHHFAAVGVRDENVEMVREAGLTWYRASASAGRGFCQNCGSTLFWKGDNSPLTYVLLGPIDSPTGLKLEAHVWVSEKGDYYEIADGLRQFEER